nr:uncharacterized protein I203_08279 [Kwoniella mangroviensis CBS 8507]OCF62647.1 hypothetical protein I203_08279 [Kwoniella mangroviensis CBS 8507]
MHAALCSASPLMPNHRKQSSRIASRRSLPEGATLAKACNRCHERKIKCDGGLPRCGSCAKNDNNECNVKDCILWSNSRVTELEARIHWLEQLINRECQKGDFIQSIPTGSLVHEFLSTRNEFAVDELAEEVGMLSLRACGSYSMFTPSNDLERCAEVGHIVGSMSGITIAALVSSSLSLYGEVVMGDAVDSQTQHPTGRPPIIACFPPVDLLSSYITGYLTSVHQWYPIIDLNLLGDSLHAMYQSREHMDLFPRFVILMVAALAPPNPDDMNDPADYFRFAITLVPSLLASKTLDGIKVLLLLCIYGMRSWQCSAAQDVNTWELIGMAMRLAVSIGLTRNNEKWSFTLAEVEHRRKVWWSLYSMERYIAIMTGRILSIRNEGIDALMPQTLYETLPDRLLAFLPKSLTAVDYRPFVHLIEQRRLLGDVLGTVYITYVNRTTGEHTD